MQAKDYPLNVVLQERQQWAIPVYQRTYAWETKEDKQLPNLWADLRDRASERLDGHILKPHFVGAIIYTQPQDQPFGTVNKRFLVDGQQRITTFSLLLCALRECARDHNYQRLTSTIDEYLFNAKSASMIDPEREQFKLWLSSYDRPIYTVLAQSCAEEVRKALPYFFFQNGRINWSAAPKVLAAYWYLKEQFTLFVKEKSAEDVSPEITLEAILYGFLNGFQIVVVQLGQEDDAQAIFASLNGNAQPLTSFDLIRNDIFHRARKAAESDDALYSDHWKTLETDFWKAEVKQGRLKRPRTDHLITHTVVAETAQDISVGQVSNEYRRFTKARAYGSVAEEVQALLRYAQSYEEMEKRVDGKPLSGIATFLNIWEMSALHPIVLWISVQAIAQVEKNAIYSVLENYVVRRDLCALTNKSYNKVVPVLLRDMHKSDNPYSTFLTHINSLTIEMSRMPTDAEVISAVVEKPLHTLLGSRKLSYILLKIELALRNKFDEAVSISNDNLTVEHILPVAWAKNWPLPSGKTVASENFFSPVALGSELSDLVRRQMETRETLKHTLGNLTILNSSLNPSLGNASWADKRGRIAKSLLAINRFASDHDTWGEEKIQARGMLLAAIVNKVWPYLEA